MATQKRDANWINIDLATLSTEQRKAYEAYKAKYAEMKAQRETFEALISKAIAPPSGKRVVFGYNFGKLSLAVVDDDAKAKRPALTGASLADLIRR